MNETARSASVARFVACNLTDLRRDPGLPTTRDESRVAFDAAGTATLDGVAVATGSGSAAAPSTADDALFSPMTLRRATWDAAQALTVHGAGEMTHSALAAAAEQARSEGRELGYAQGYAQGVEAAQAQVQSAASEAQSRIDEEFRRLRDTIAAGAAAWQDAVEAERARTRAVDQALLSSLLEVAIEVVCQALPLLGALMDPAQLIEAAVADFGKSQEPVPQHVPGTQPGVEVRMPEWMWTGIDERLRDRLAAGGYECVADAELRGSDIVVQHASGGLDRRVECLVEAAVDSLTRRWPTLDVAGRSETGAEHA